MFTRRSDPNRGVEIMKLYSTGIKPRVFLCARMEIHSKNLGGRTFFIFPFHKVKNLCICAEEFNALVSCPVKAKVLLQIRCLLLCSKPGYKNIGGS